MVFFIVIVKTLFQQAVYAVSTMDSFYITMRMMEVIINVVGILMDMGVLKNWQPDQSKEFPPTINDPLLDLGKDKDNKVKSYCV